MARELRQLRAELKAVAKASEYKEAHAASARAQLVAQQAEAKACEKEAEQQDHLIRTLQVTDDGHHHHVHLHHLHTSASPPPPSPLQADLSLQRQLEQRLEQQLQLARASCAAQVDALAQAGREAREQGDALQLQLQTEAKVIEGMEEYCAQLQAGLASQAADAKEAKEGKEGKEIVPGRELIKAEVEEVRGRLALLKREESRLTTALGEQRRALNTQEAEFAAEMRRCQEQREAKAAALAQLEKYEGELRKAA